MDLVDEDQVGAQPGEHVADGVGDVGLVLAGAVTGSAGEPGELGGEHLRGGGGRDGDVDDRHPPGRGLLPEPVRGAAARGCGPSWVTAVVLPVPAAPVTIRPRRALTWCRFSRTSRRPVAYDLPDDGGGDHDQPGVVVRAVLVVGCAARPLPAAPGRRRRGAWARRGRHRRTAASLPGGQREVIARRRSPGAVRLGERVEHAERLDGQPLRSRLASSPARARVRAGGARAAVTAARRRAWSGRSPAAAGRFPARCSRSVQDPGDRGLVGVVLPAGGQDLAGVPPGEVRERRGTPSAGGSTAR